MNLTYKKATIQDIDILTKTRIKVLRAANKLSCDIDMSEVESRSHNYYKKALSDSVNLDVIVTNNISFVVCEISF